ELADKIACFRSRFLYIGDVVVGVVRCIRIDHHGAVRGKYHRMKTARQKVETGGRGRVVNALASEGFIELRKFYGESRFSHRRPYERKSGKRAVRHRKRNDRRVVACRIGVLHRSLTKHRTKGVFVKPESTVIIRDDRALFRRGS